jgi:hypothetical protein
MLLELDDSEFVDEIQSDGRAMGLRADPGTDRPDQRGVSSVRISTRDFSGHYYSINMKLLSDHYRNGGSDEVLLGEARGSRRSHEERSGEWTPCS